MAERRSPLAECLKPGVYGAAGPGGPGVEIREPRPLTAVQVAAFDAERAATSIGTALGAPTGRNGVAISGDSVVLWTGPGRWLIVEPESRDLPSLLTDHCSSDVAAITDLSHARAALRVEGPKTRALLSKLCTLDVDPAVFSVGTCAQSQFGHIGVLLYCRAEDGFDVFVPRGFAVSAWETIIDAALEFGCRVT